VKRRVVIGEDMWCFAVFGADALSDVADALADFLGGHAP
jgi:hypothetical protein